MSIYWKHLLAAFLLIATWRSIAQTTDAYKPPLYWSTYEYNIERQHIGVSYNYIPEYELLANINWVDANLKSLGTKLSRSMDGATVWYLTKTATAPLTRYSGSTILLFGPGTCSREECDWECTATLSGSM